MTDERIEVIQDLDGVATVTINNPSRRNAVAPDMWDALATAFRELSSDPKVRAVILTGGGDCFCSGSDVEQIVLAADIPAGLARLKRANRMMLAIYNCEKPVIAAVRGPAAGVGMSLALACDFIVASEDARFGGGFTRVGLMPDGGAIYFLSHLLGSARAKEIAYSGRFVGAEEALSIGLALRLFPAEALIEGALSMARDLARGPTTAISLGKRMFRAARSPALEQFFEQEEIAQVCVKETDDFAEGMKAFAERRPAMFKGQ